MDVLSDAVTAMRTGRPHSGRVCRSAPFGQRLPPVDAAGFHIVLRGSCWLFPPDGPPVALGVGDVAFLPHGAAHGLADSPSTPLADTSAPVAEVPPGPDDPGATTVTLCGAYLLDRSRAHPLLGELPEVIHLPAQAGRHPGLRAAVDLLGGELQQPRPGGDAMVPALLDVLLLHILRAWFDEQSANGAATGWAAALGDPAVAAALRAIHGAPDRRWTVAALGTRAGMSRAAFAQRFAALVGQPPVAYLTWWRMTLAARLLRDSNAPLAAVARKVGYTSEFAFAHAFKRHYGSAPGGFRHSAPGQRMERNLTRLIPGTVGSPSDSGDVAARIASRLA